MTKSSNYWDKRAIDRLTNAEKHSEVYIQRVKRIYEQAYKDIDRELASVYRNYSKETGLDVQKLKELLTRSESEKTWKQLQKQGLDKYIKDNYKARISRLEQLQAQIYAKAKLIYPKEELENTMCYKGVINQSYLQTIYDTQIGTGYGFNFNTIDKHMVDTLLKDPWSGKNYSQRIWTNTDILANSLSQIVGGAMLSGQSIELTAKQIRDRFNVSKYYSERLIRTETNHFNNEVDAMAYEELGLKKYVYMATLDSRTSEICQELDGKVFEFSKRETGTNYPPMHPNCRSKTRAYLGVEEEKTLQRRAKNPITGKTEIIDNISYKDWIKQYNGTSVNNNIFTTNQNVALNTKSLKQLDNQLVKTNTNQLSYLLNRFPKVANFVKSRGLSFGGTNTKAIAETSHSWDMKRLGIHLSNNYYNDINTYRSAIKDNVKKGWFMPCDNKHIDTYALSHEFGHLVENYLINEYNISNPTDYNNFFAKLKNATTQYRANQIVKDYETNICDKVASDIYNIALANDKKFVLNANISRYGLDSSQEFFAECFANMVSGKPNALGKAMAEYLKGVM